MRKNTKAFDALLRDKNLKSRIETNLTFHEMIAALGQKENIVKAVRDGLGIWNIVFIDLNNTTALISAPEDQPDAGCSIWFTSSSEAHMIAACFQQCMQREDLLFLDPDTGEMVSPVSMQTTDETEQLHLTAAAHRY